MPRKFENLAGKRFGRLTIISPSTNAILTTRPRAYWNCLCDCGKEKIVCADGMKSGRTQSCGCYRREQSSKAATKHGLKHTHIYEVWLGIKKRCLNKNRPDYRYYGARGIKMHEPWARDVALFAKETSEGYAPTLTIDRIDVDGDYAPGNIRWIDHTHQMRNRRNNVVITHGGKTMCAAEWDRKLGLSRGCITRMMHRRKITCDAALSHFLK